MDAAHLAGKRLDEMSTGEVRRILIARALVNDPKALVLDEPSAGLDLVARFRFLEMVRRIARDGTTVVMITHHVEELIPEIERVILLQDGRVVDSGAKRAMLTSDRLSALFGATISVEERNGYFAARCDVESPVTR